MTGCLPVASLSHYMPRPDLWTLRGADSRRTGGVCTRGTKAKRVVAGFRAGGYPFSLFGCVRMNIRVGGPPFPSKARDKAMAKALMPSSSKPGEF